MLISCREHDGFDQRQQMTSFVPFVKGTNRVDDWIHSSISLSQIFPLLLNHSKCFKLVSVLNDVGGAFSVFRCCRVPVPEPWGRTQNIPNKPRPFYEDINLFSQISESKVVFVAMQQYKKKKEEVKLLLGALHNYLE